MSGFHLQHRHRWLFRKLQTSVGRLQYHKASWDILFFGTDEFALESLKTLNNFKQNKQLINNLDVVCPVDTRRLKDIRKDKNVKTVRQFSEINHLKIHDWPLDQKKALFLSDFHLGIVISFGHFIPAWILHKLQRGAINIHPSLLPRWRGAAPIVHTMLHGDTTTGISIIDVSTEKFDIGRILLQKKITIEPYMRYKDLSQKLSHLSSNSIERVLVNFDYYKHNAIAQDETAQTKAPKLTKEFGFIKWELYSCVYIQRLWYAVSELIGLRSRWCDKTVKLVQLVGVKYDQEDLNFKPGQPKYDHNNDILLIKCKDGWTCWQKLQFEHKQVITAKEFYNGYLVNDNNCIFESL